jgi:hypothetical protein
MSATYRNAEPQGVRHRHEFQEHGGNLAATNRAASIQSATGLEKALVDAICERTAGRVRSLQVQILGDGMVLRGWADSYHAVQLAIAGLFQALSAMDIDRPEKVEVDIEVLPNVPGTGVSR